MNKLIVSYDYNMLEDSHRLIFYDFTWIEKFFFDKNTNEEVFRKDSRIENASRLLFRKLSLLGYQLVLYLERISDEIWRL